MFQIAGETEDYQTHIELHVLDGGEFWYSETQDWIPMDLSRKSMRLLLESALILDTEEDFARDVVRGHELLELGNHQS